MLIKRIVTFGVGFLWAVPALVQSAETGNMVEDFSGVSRREERRTDAFWDTANKAVSLPLRYSVRDLAKGLQDFNRQAAVAVATDGQRVLVASAAGKVNLVAQDGAALDLTATLPNLKSVKGVGYLSRAARWVIVGEAKGGRGAMVYTMAQEGGAVQDHQTQARSVGLDRVDSIWCPAPEHCFIYDGPGAASRRTRAFDGQTFTDVTTQTLPLPLTFKDVVSRFPRVPPGRLRDDASAVEAGVFTYVVGSGFWVNLSGGLELTSGRIPELKSVQVRALAAHPDGAVVVAGSGPTGPALVELQLQGFVPSATLEFKKLADAPSGKFFKRATVTGEGDFPEKTRVEYLASGDAAVHFESVTSGVAHEFINKGQDLRAKVVLFTEDQLKTPYLTKLRVDFEKAEAETLENKRRRDQRRIADLRDIATKLERFKRDRQTYPLVDDRDPKVRWEMLGRLLMEGKYLTRLPQDPKQVEESDRSYDYVAAKGGNAYLLRTKLEEGVSGRLAKDVDGQPVEPNLFDYSCDDPWYCEGKGFVAATAPPESPPASRGTAELWRAEDGRVYRIAQLGGGATPRELRRVYIPRPSVLQKLTRFYGNMRQVGKVQLTQAPRAKLVKLPDKDDIYYITETFLKRRLPSRAVFESYGNDLREVVAVQPEELEAYPDSRLIRLTGDKKIWYLEGGVRRHVKDPSVMRSRGFKWNQVAPVNFAEYNSYPEGKPLE